MLLTAPLSVYAIDNGPSWFGFSYTLNTPGARTIGMGGTAVASVNDATATLTNPAALVRLTKNEFRFDTNYRYLEAVNEPGKSNLGTGKSIQMGLEVEETNQADPALMALATPVGDGKTVLALFYHEFLPYDRSVNVTDPISGGIAEKHNVMFDLDEFGFSIAHRFEKELSIGLSASLVTPNMFIRTLRDDTPSATFSGVEFSSYGSKSEQEPVWRLGLLYEPDETVSMGINYTLTQDPQYVMTIANTPETVNSAPANGCTTDISGNWMCQSALPMPNILSIGFEFTPNERWSFAVEAIQIDYGSSVDEFVAVYAYPDGDVQVVQTRADFQSDEVTEYHAGLEYNTMLSKYPLSLRAGYYYDPAHDIKYIGEDATSKVIFTGGEDVHHLTAGFGMLFKESLKVGMAVDAGDDDNFRAALSLAYQY
jgi:long-subunit fatty acid transport protein